MRVYQVSILCRSNGTSGPFLTESSDFTGLGLNGRGLAVHGFTLIMLIYAQFRVSGRKLGIARKTVHAQVPYETGSSWPTREANLVVSGCDAETLLSSKLRLAY